MNLKTKTTWTADEAIERFDEDMNNSCDDGDRKMALAWLLARLIASGLEAPAAETKAINCRDAYMAQRRREEWEMENHVNCRYA